VRSQIQLRDDQVRHLREVAATEDVSLAESIQRGVDLLLDESRSVPGRQRLELTALL